MKPSHDPRTRLDYKPQARLLEPPLRARRGLLTVVSAILMAGIAIGWINARQATSSGPAARLDLSVPAATPLTPAEDTAPTATAEAAPDLRSHTLTVKSGDTLAGLFSRAKLKAADLAAIMDAGHGVKRLRRLMPGDKVQIMAGPNGAIQSLSMEVDRFNALHVVRSGDGFKASTDALPLQRHIRVARGTVRSSLFAAGADAGMSDKLIMNMAGIFGWDIDFVKDLRPGDSFTVIYDELYRDGEKLDDGDILAAEFTNAGHEFRAVRFTDPNGNTDYYSPDGRSMRKALIRTPVDFTRISSGFTLHRKHPILNRIRRHEGVDYAAPTGTPIKSAGDGKIVFRGRKGGYGNCIVIKHGSRYSTLYGHMSHFKRGLHVGSRVKQNQVIGYVGMTGLATGPHLHFEVRVNGVPRNPRTVDLPDAEPIDPLYRAQFLATARPLLEQLKLADEGDTQMFAAAGG